MGEIPARGFEILMKALFSREVSQDHLLTDFPGQVTEGSGPGCMAYHFA